MPDPINLFGDVGGEIAPDRVAAALKAAGKQPIEIRINSYGGDALAGIAIHNMLARHPGRKTVRVEGVAASAASLIMMAGDDIVMPANAFAMLHDAWGLAMGDAEAMHAQGDLLGRVTDAYRATYAKRTGLPEDRIAEMMRAETWLTAAEAKELGFATHVTEPAETRMVASAAARRLVAIPAAARRFLSVKETPPMDGMTTPTPPAATPATLAQVKDIAARAKLGAEWVLAQVEAGATTEAAQAAAIDAVAAAANVQPIRPAVQVVRDEGDTLAEAEADYIAARLLNREPKGAGSRFRGYSLADVLAEGRLAQRGVRVGRGTTADRIFAMTTTSDLPLLVSSGASRAMQDLFQTVRTPLLQLADVRNLPDFRPTTLIRIAQHKPLDLVVEAGPVTNVYATEKGEPVRLATYSNNHPISRQTLINDDLGGLAAWLGAAAQAAAARERVLLAGLLTDGAGLGPTLSDGLPWFDASRANIGAPAPLDANSLADAVAKMRALKDPAGQTIYGLEPFAIVVSPEREYAARALTAASAMVTDRADVQPYSLSVIVEPALTGVRWWLAPQPGLRRCIVAAYLNGVQAPMVETFTEPQVLGTTIRVTWDVAAAVGQPEGWVTNAGAS